MKNYVQKVHFNIGRSSTPPAGRALSSVPAPLQHPHQFPNLASKLSSSAFSLHPHILPNDNNSRTSELQSLPVEALQLLSESRRSRLQKISECFIPPLSEPRGGLVSSLPLWTPCLPPECDISRRMIDQRRRTIF